MAKAVKCPVCEKKGCLIIEGKEKKCHGCFGKGWIEISEDNVYPWWYWQYLTYNGNSYVYINKESKT